MHHRGDAYWSVFDVKTHTEKKIDTALVNGYARTSDIEFLDEDHILTYGESVFMGEDENYETYCINLDTLKIEKKYNGTGEIDMKWDYRYDKKDENPEIFGFGKWHFGDDTRCFHYRTDCSC